MNFTTETPENFEQKCCCVLVLDVSSSMEGESINKLNLAIQEFQQDISNDTTMANRLEVAIVEFSNTVSTVVDPALVENFTMPVLTTKGTTALVDGVREGIGIARNRKAWYKQTGQPYYRPWVILITDGYPDRGQDVNGLKNEIQDGMKAKDFYFFALGVDGANMNILNEISGAEMPAAYLQGRRFGEFFKWLSKSMGSVTHSKDGDKINLPSPAGWMTGFTV